MMLWVRLLQSYKIPIVDLTNIEPKNLGLNCLVRTILNHTAAEIKIDGCTHMIGYIKKVIQFILSY